MANQEKEETIVNVQEVYTKTELFVDRNRKPLLIALGAVAVAFAGFFAYRYLVVNPKEEKASQAAWKAEQWMEMDSTDWALNGNGTYDGFESIIANFDGTKTAKRAHYFAGIIYRDNGDFQAALEHFKEADFEDEAVGIIAMGNVGDMHVQLGNIEEGASWLEKAARRANSSSSRNLLGPVYLLKAAKAYMELSNMSKAKSLLQEVTDNYDNKTQDYNEAAKLLAMLKAQD